MQESVDQILEALQGNPHAKGFEKVETACMLSLALIKQQPLQSCKRWEKHWVM
jgi:hypothetical protein